MKARTINKRDLDELIRLERKFYRTGDADILSARSVVCDDIAHATMTGLFAISDIVGGILQTNGLRPKATNAEIYAVFELLGWRVVDRGGNDESERMEEKT